MNHWYIALTRASESDVRLEVRVGYDVIPNPVRAPNANAFMERVRHEVVWITVQEVLRQTFNEPAVPSAVL